MSIKKGTTTVAGRGRDGTGFTLFTPVWQDHIVNNISWLRADTFSWQSGAVYTAAYNHLLADYNEVANVTRAPEPTTENIKTDTIGSIAIEYYLANDGHKIALPSQESKVLELYNTTGVAWYYILDTTNQRFKLPRTKYNFTGLRDTVGKYVAPGLPNHTHVAYGSANYNGGSNNAFGNGSSNPYTLSDVVGGVVEDDVYGASDTVQPPATEAYLYFFVGNYEQDAIVQTAGINSELFNNKADTDLGNVSSNLDYVVDSYEDGSNWYRVYKSGWVEQGGITPAILIQAAPSSSSYAVTLLKPISKLYAYYVKPSAETCNVVLGFGSPLTFTASNGIWTRSLTGRDLGTDKNVRAIWYVCGQGK